MKVLVTAASRHGATVDIAATIARRLSAGGIEADPVEPAKVGSLDGYDAVVLGSAVYMGRWLEPAKKLAADNSTTLKGMSVWIFSSGPLGEPLMPAEDPADAAAMVALTGAREHRVFAGKLDRRQLGLTEKAIVTMVRAADGDYRPWPEIEAWAAQIAATLTTADGAN